MRNSKPLLTEPDADPPERMWPLDASIAALAGLVLYLIVTRLRFDDPRWMFNAWTHAIAVPVIAFALAFFSHGFVTRYVQKSIQLGFLFSVFVHLMLLVVAINVVIFSRYFPNAFSGSEPERSSAQRTIPEYVFQTPDEMAPAPDWSKPVDAETASRIIPEEQRRTPPLEQSQPLLELPRPRELEIQPPKQFLIQRDQPTESQPRPTDSPTKLARRETRTPRKPPKTSSPTAPNVPAQASASETVTPRNVAPPRAADASSVSLSAPQPSLPSDFQPTTPVPVQSPRNLSRSLPRVGESGQQPERRIPSAAQRPQPAGSSPSPPPTVALARDQEESAWMKSPEAETTPQRGQASGAQVALGDLANPGIPLAMAVPSGASLPDREPAAQPGLPSVTAGQSEGRRGRGREWSPNPLASAGPLAPAGIPRPDDAAAVATTDSDLSAPAIASERNELQALPARSAAASGTSVAAQALAEATAEPPLDLPIELGPIGLTGRSGVKPGVIPSSNRIDKSAIDFPRGRRPKREVGGPITPFGNKVASVESFQRRITRTRGGAPPAPAGMVGPATEEAIELGLAYLAERQNEDGSWSLQGHGTEVLLQSDSAATGLCLLAFQGAGYTHRQHQYADTVSRGLKFLVDNQRTNGDLYRREDPLSDQNVAFYSHGIASLAVCEAYGMTQDTELKDPAQAALDYIVQTQHRKRGGWRYTPQVSADTSVTGWMMMALKSGQLSGLEVPSTTYQGIQKWLRLAQSPQRPDRYRYNPFAPDTPTQRHGQRPTPTMTSVGMLMRMYLGWRRDNRAMRSAADYLLKYPPQIGTPRSPQRDTYYWYYATQVMFHMGGQTWEQWNRFLNPLLVDSQIKNGPEAGSWDPKLPVPDRWGAHAGGVYVTSMNLLSLEVYYRHLPIYEDTAQ